MKTIREEYEEYYDNMEYIAKTFYDSKCAVSHKPFERKGFSIHHLEEFDGDVLKRNYTKRYSRKSTASLLYIRDLRKQLETDTTLQGRTILIKNYIHARYDHYKNGINRFPMEQRIRFCKYALMTITKRVKK